MTESEESAIHYLLRCGVTPDCSPCFCIGSYDFPNANKTFLDRLAATLTAPDTGFLDRWFPLAKQEDHSKRPSIFRR